MDGETRFLNIRISPGTFGDRFRDQFFEDNIILLAVFGD
jgi:hypothetical protein